MSQSLNSPTTVTFSALGAHTAKRTPGMPSGCGEVRAQGVIRLLKGAFGVEVEIHVGDLRAEAVRVFDVDFTPVPLAGADEVTFRIAIQDGAEETLGMQLLHVAPLPAGFHRGRFRLGQKGAHFPAALPGLLAHPVRSEYAKGIAVVAADYRFDLFNSHESL